MWQAKVIAHSVSSGGRKIITGEFVYPRMIHSEMMTHRMLSKNAASSRAIPVEKVIKMVRENPATPIHWGKNQPGMQAHEELSGDSLNWTVSEWMDAANDAANHAEKMHLYGAHKQVVNRILEPFQWMKTVVTGTEWENVFWLRDHEDADPTIAHLIKMFKRSVEESIPVYLGSGDWHVPYFFDGWWKRDQDYGYSLEDAIKISMSCCAQTSFRTSDDTIEKANRVVSRLNLGTDLNKPVHASPSEHQATPMLPSCPFGNGGQGTNLQGLTCTWQDGITAYHKELGFMSGNFSGFIQNRQLIKGNTKW